MSIEFQFASFDQESAFNILLVEEILHQLIL